MATPYNRWMVHHTAVGTLVAEEGPEGLVLWRFEQSASSNLYDEPVSDRPSIFHVESIEMEALGQDRAKDTGEKDVEEIEERADAGDRDDRAMRRRNRQPIEPRSNSRARSGRFAYVVSAFSRTLIQPSH